VKEILEKPITSPSFDRAVGFAAAFASLVVGVICAERGDWLMASICAVTVFSVSTHLCRDSRGIR
jgi:hypothetical protein